MPKITSFFIGNTIVYPMQKVNTFDIQTVTDLWVK